MMDENSNEEGLNSSEFDNENEDFEDEDYEEDYENRSANPSNNNSVNNSLLGLSNVDEDTISVQESKSALRKKRGELLRYAKKRKCRTTFTKSQLSTLEKEFAKSNFINNDRIDVLIEITGLDARIIKNWFKNKRSRVLADSKSNPSSHRINATDVSSLTNRQQQESFLFHTETSNSNHLPAEHLSSNQLFPTQSIKETYLITNNEAPSVIRPYSTQTEPSNEPVLSSIFHNSKLDKIQKVLETKEINIDLANLKETSCKVCSKAPIVFCVCNVSNTALSKLYKNSIGFNSNSAFYCYNQNETLNTVTNGLIQSGAKTCSFQRKVNESKWPKETSFLTQRIINCENGNLVLFENEFDMIEKVLEIL